MESLPTFRQLIHRSEPNFLPLNTSESAKGTRFSLTLRPWKPIICDLFRGRQANVPAYRSQHPAVRPGSRGDSSYEENLSTQPHQTRTHPRFPGTDGHPQRPEGAPVSPRQGQGSPDSLNKRLIPAAVPRKARPRSTSFPRQARLLKPSDFRLVFSKSNRSADGFFTVLVANSKDTDLARLGLAISKKCAKGAVERNRLKRIVRESFRTHRDMLAPLDLIVMCRPKAVHAKNGELMASLLEHWDHVNQSRQCGS